MSSQNLKTCVCYRDILTVGYKTTVVCQKQTNKKYHKLNLYKTSYKIGNDLSEFSSVFLEAITTARVKVTA